MNAIEFASLDTKTEAYKRNARQHTEASFIIAERNLRIIGTQVERCRSCSQ